MIVRLLSERNPQITWFLVSSRLPPLVPAKTGGMEGGGRCVGGRVGRGGRRFRRRGQKVGGWIDCVAIWKITADLPHTSPPPLLHFPPRDANFPLTCGIGWISIFSNSSTARENTRMILIFFAKVLVLKISRNCLIENLESLFGVNLIWIGFSLRASRFTAGVWTLHRRNHVQPCWTLTVILRGIPDQLDTPRNPRIINPFNRINLLVE